MLIREIRGQNSGLFPSFPISNSRPFFVPLVLSFLRFFLRVLCVSFLWFQISNFQFQILPLREFFPKSVFIREIRGLKPRPFPQFHP